MAMEILTASVGRIAVFALLRRERAASGTQTRTRQPHGYAGAFAKLALESDAAAMGFGKSLHDGKAKAGSLFAVRHVMASLPEALEHPQLIVLRDADAVVPDAECELAALRQIGEYLDLAAGAGELQRVGQKVQNDLLQCPLVAERIGQAGFDRAPQCDARAGRARLEDRRAVRQQR